MPRAVGAGLLVLVVSTGCTHFNGSPPPVADAPAPPVAEQLSPQGSAAAEAPDTPPATPPTAPPTAGAPAAGPQAIGPQSTGAPAAESPPALPPVPPHSAAKPAQPKTAGNANPKTARGTGAPAAGSQAAGSPSGGSSKPMPSEQRGTPAAGETATVQHAAQPAARPPSPPALDLTGLEQRLKDTHAIGLFTKLSLKNQVDDLLGAFRAFHSGQIPPPLPELRQRYDLLLLKVLTLLQDGDPPLASAISASREAIWGLLADRDKFQKIQMG